MPLNITTRQTRVSDITNDQTNEVNGVPQDSTNAGVALSNVQVDQNFINIKHLVDLNTSRLNKSHDADGSITDLVIEADDLKPNSVDYSKLKSIHYAAVVDANWTSANGTSVDVGTANSMQVKIDSLTALETGMLFFVRARLTNTGSSKLTLHNSTAVLATDIDIVKGPFVGNNDGLALIEGDIRQGQVAALLYDGSSFQLINPTRPLVAFVAEPEETAAGNKAAIVSLLTNLKAAGIMATE